MNCDKCKRPGDLIDIYVTRIDGEIHIFRFYLCRYHRAAENQPRMRRVYGGKGVKVIADRPDGELLEEFEQQQKR